VRRLTTIESDCCSARKKVLCRARGNWFFWKLRHRPGIPTLVTSNLLILAAMNVLCPCKSIHTNDLRFNRHSR